MIILLLAGIIFLLPTLITLPAILSLPAGQRPVFRVFSSWGSAFVNALVYYKTGSDKVKGEVRN